MVVRFPSSIILDERIFRRFQFLIQVFAFAPSSPLQVAQQVEKGFPEAPFPAFPGQRTPAFAARVTGEYGEEFLDSHERVLPS